MKTIAASSSLGPMNTSGTLSQRFKSSYGSRGSRMSQPSKPAMLSAGSLGAIAKDQSPRGSLQTKRETALARILACIAGDARRSLATTTGYRDAPGIGMTLNAVRSAHWKYVLKSADTNRS